MLEPRPKAPVHAFAKTLKSFTTAAGRQGQLYSLPALARTFPNVARMPISLRIVLESVLRNCDGQKVTAAHVEELANWAPQAERAQGIELTTLQLARADGALTLEFSLRPKLSHAVEDALQRGVPMYFSAEAL